MPLVAGNHVSLRFSVLQPSGQPFDLTGFSDVVARLQFNGAAAVEYAATVDDAERGKCSVEVEGVDVVAGEIVGEVRVTDALGHDYTSRATFTLPVREPLT